MKTFKTMLAVRSIACVVVFNLLSHASASELIVNGGFESGSGTSVPNWTVAGGAALNGAAGSSVYAHSGSQYMILGAAVSEVDSVYQTISVPSGVSTVTLSFYENITTHETTTTTAFDTMTVTIRNTSGTVLQTIANYSNLNKDSALGIWHQKTADLAAYKGQTIRVYFASSNDSSLSTSFEIDDVSVATTTATPSISSVSPLSMVASNGNQTLTINGNNFDPSATLTFDPPTGANIDSTEAKFTSKGSSQLVYQINNAGDAGTWYVRVNNPGSVSSGWASFTVTNAPTPPSITSVSPPSMVASNGNQTLTINGSNFDPAATLTFDPPTGANIDSTEAKFTSKSSSQLVYQINNAGDAGTWYVRVNNPGGVSSGWTSFAVTNAPTPPSISGVSPLSMVASNGNQTLTINGSNFDPAATLTFDPPTGANIDSTEAKFTSKSSSQLVYQINNANDVGTWYVRVNNPGGVSSGWASFAVTNAPTPPSITGVAPLFMVASNGNQTLTISGNNFDPAATLTFDPPTGANIDSAEAKFTSKSATQLAYLINNANDFGTWYVRVNNPGGVSSGWASFTVTNSITTTTTNRALGVDVFHGRGNINWPLVASFQESFAIIKASDGYRTSQALPMVTDSQFSTYAPAAKQAGMIVGAYHFGRPYINSAKDEADFFISVAGNYIGPGYLPPALDIEDPDDELPNHPVSALGKAVLSQWIRDWCAEVEAVKHVKPMIYMTPSFARTLMDSDLSQYPLWIAYYERQPDVDPQTDGAAPLGPWNYSWTFLQYSVQGHVLDSAVQNPPEDLNVFNGNLNALSQFINQGGTIFTGIGGGGIQPPTDGKFQCEIHAPSLTQVNVKVSDDCIHWSNFMTLTITNGMAMLIDSNAWAHSSRFYLAEPQ